MKITFRILAIATLFFIGLNTTEAQRGNRNINPEERAEQQTNTMNEQLSLSAKQAEKVKEINLKYANKMKEMRDSNTGGDWSAMREAMSAIRQEQDNELKTVLTTEQFEKWSKYVEDKQSQRGRKGNNGKDTPKEKGN